MADKIEISGENAGLHLLLKFDPPCTEEALVERAKAAGIRVYGLSEYYIESDIKMPRNVIVLGYASFTEEEIENAVALLGHAWSAIY